MAFLDFSPYLRVRVIIYCRKHRRMSNSFFKFKQFTIEQDGCAMKVGTDGCLIGAWFDVSNCKKILDIGSGTGLISIMAAQRCNALVTGIEIEPVAVEVARANVNKTPWSDRINILNKDLRYYSPEERYDTIVSNPPYFTDSLKCHDEKRTLARHNDTLTPALFFSCAKKLLTDNGKISIIVPADTLSEWTDNAVFNGLSATKITYVHTTPKKPVKRVMVEFSRKATAAPVVEKFVLEVTPGVYSTEAQALLCDFYLKL